MGNISTFNLDNRTKQIIRLEKCINKYDETKQHPNMAESKTGEPTSKRKRDSSTDRQFNIFTTGNGKGQNRCVKINK
jgi:hypothetical protein